jgi:hypothetical protein
VEWLKVIGVGPEFKPQYCPPKNNSSIIRDMVVMPKEGEMLSFSRIF